MKIVSLIAVFWSSTIWAEMPRKLDVSHGDFAVSTIPEYSHSWHQCTLQENQWIDMPSLKEEVTFINDDQIRLHQTSVMQNGMVQAGTQYYDRATFGPKKMEVNVALPGQPPVYQATYDLNESGYTGVVTRQDGRTDVSGSINSHMLNGSTMGLPLAMITNWSKPVSFKASMMSFDGTYDVVAEHVGSKTIQIAGEEINLLLIDVTWNHLESGDIYPPGPEATGGQYWIRANPSPNLPHVIRYKTDSYAIEFVPVTCSDSND